MFRQYSIDQALALVLLPSVAVVLAVLYVVVVALQGRPFIFTSERMRSKDQAFYLLKIRTMKLPEQSMNETALGGDQKWRVTPVGAFLRRTRLDELPQIFNVLRGELRFVGPRPPLRKYVEQYPVLYGQVLADTRPGITGLATVILHAREERLLSRCRTSAETDAVYRRRCIPMKARLDLVYRDNRGWVLNAMILWMTFSRLLPRSLADMVAVKILWSPVVFRRITGGFYRDLGRAGEPMIDNA
ncbi:sugar transferase [Rhodobacteraceae bacterium]|nr:sugar transferase [Paracoccaceae bacterium]